ncbi:MAG: hypothetical protein RL141_805 [Candidatus Parcubacteria bacterium]|jgi:GNAT superfamily N-acetyltransferase
MSAVSLRSEISLRFEWLSGHDGVLETRDPLASPIGKLLECLTPKRRVTVVGLWELLAARETHLLLAWDGNQLAGMATLIPFHRIGQRGGWIEDVVVDPKVRRRHVGRRLMEELTRRAKELQMSRLVLMSHAENGIAHSFYAAQGFNTERHVVFCKKLKKD